LLEILDNGKTATERETDRQINFSPDKTMPLQQEKQTHPAKLQTNRQQNRRRSIREEKEKKQKSAKP
jgi:hypothetical protein